jgi:tetratricopeptide (TPR) repeat protein
MAGLQRIGDRIRVTIQLIRSDDGKSLWAETFDEKFTDIFTLEDSLSAQVARALAIKLTGADVAQLKRHSTNNLEADQFYQLGRYHMNRGGADATTKAVAAFEQAIDKDPEFALAYAGLACAHGALGFAGVDAASPGTEFGKAKKAAAKALEIDNSLAEAHTALGGIAFHYDWNWPEAEKELKRAIELNPNLAEAHHEYSNYLAGMDRLDEGLREITRAKELDPLSLIINFHYGLALFGAGHDDEALAHYRKFLNLDPNNAAGHWGIASVYQHQRKYDEAIKEYEIVRKLDPRTSFRLGNLACVYALAGRRDEAVNLLNQLLDMRKKGVVSPSTLATIYAALGDSNRTFESIDQAYGARDSLMPYIRRFDWPPAIRQDRRYPEVIQRMKFPSGQ